MAEKQLDITVLRGSPKREPPTPKKTKAVKVGHIPPSIQPVTSQILPGSIPCPDVMTQSVWVKGGFFRNLLLPAEIVTRFTDALSSWIK
jgi:hypothetical protein